MSQFIVVTDDESQADHSVELPTEPDGMLLLSTIEAQFSGATGLKYRAPSGAYRGLRVADNSVCPPQEGWGTSTYVVVMRAEAAKRRHEGDSLAPPAKQYSTGASSGGGGSTAVVTEAGEMDLIVLGLAWKARNEDVREYFSQFGELAFCQVNMDAGGRSKGFGFIRFADPQANQKVLDTPHHYIMGRRCEVKTPVRRNRQEIPRKLFIGCLTQEIVHEDLRTHFGTYGALTDVYIPEPFRGIAFVTFATATAACECLENAPHVVKGVRLNVSTPEPRKNPESQEQRHAAAAASSPYGYGSQAVAAAPAGQLTTQALLGQLALAASSGSLAGLGIGAVQQQQQHHHSTHHQQQQQHHQQSQHHAQHQQQQHQHHHHAAGSVNQRQAATNPAYPWGPV